MKKLYTIPFLAIAFLLCIGQHLSAQVTDGSFEGGIGAGTWTESSTNFGTPLCDAACGTCGGPCAPRTGLIYGWFGGFGGGVETGTLSQSVTIPTSTDTTWLEFYFFIAIPNGTGGDFFAVMMGSDTVFYATDGDSTAYSAYTRVLVNAEAYEGTTSMLTFTSTTSGVPGVTNFLLDDVSIGDMSVDITNSQIVKEHFAVSPNPATDALNIDIQLAESQNVDVEIMTMTGEVVYHQNLNKVRTGMLNLDVSSFAAGTYLVKVNKENGTWIEKVTIQ